MPRKSKTKKKKIASKSAMAFLVPATATFPRGEEIDFLLEEENPDTAVLFEFDFQEGD